MKTPILLFMISLSLLAGCKAESYRWAKTDAGFPAKQVQTFETDNMTIRYCLVMDSENSYYFEGVARSKGRVRLGRVSSGNFTLALFQYGKLVHKVILSRQGDRFDQDIYLRKAFRYDGPFNDVGFGWHLKYSN